MTEKAECPHLWLQWMHHDHAVKCLVCGAKIPPKWDGWDEKTTETPICEHCDHYLTEVHLKTTVFYTYIPEANQYMNTERNFDAEGTTWIECPHCGKETDSVTFTEDGLLVPKEAE